MLAARATMLLLYTTTIEYAASVSVRSGVFGKNYSDLICFTQARIHIAVQDWQYICEHVSQEIKRGGGIRTPSQIKSRQVPLHIRSVVWTSNYHISPSLLLLPVDMPSSPSTPNSQTPHTHARQQHTLTLCLQSPNRSIIHSYSLSS